MLAAGLEYELTQIPGTVILSGRATTIVNIPTTRPVFATCELDLCASFKPLFPPIHELEDDVLMC